MCFLVVCKPWIANPPVELLQTMEMIEDQVFTVHCHPSILVGDAILGNVPGCQVGPFIGKYQHSRKPCRPAIQIFLVRETAVLGAVITPFQTLLTPPFKTFCSCRIIPEAEQADVKYSILLQSFQGLRVAVRNNEYRVILERME